MNYNTVKSRVGLSSTLGLVQRKALSSLGPHLTGKV
jgi:hypothetical protein